MYMMLVCIIACGLLILNIVLVSAFIHSNREWLLGFYADTNVQFRIAQAAQIFLPVIMTMFEYWLFDRLIDRAFGYGRETGPS